MMESFKAIGEPTDHTVESECPHCGHSSEIVCDVPEGKVITKPHIVHCMACCKEEDIYDALQFVHWQHDRA